MCRAGRSSGRRQAQAGSHDACPAGVGGGRATSRRSGCAGHEEREALAERPTRPDVEPGAGRHGSRLPGVHDGAHAVHPDARALGRHRRAWQRGPRLRGGAGCTLVVRGRPSQWHYRRHQQLACTQARRAGMLGSWRPSRAGARLDLERVFVTEGRAAGHGDWVHPAARWSHAHGQDPLRHVVRPRARHDGGPGEIDDGDGAGWRAARVDDNEVPPPRPHGQREREGVAEPGALVRGAAGPALAVPVVQFFKFASAVLGEDRDLAPTQWRGPGGAEG